MAEMMEVYACMPSAERGQGIQVDGDQFSSSVIYCNGRCVIIRSLVDPLKSDVVCGHSYPVTVARFSPNAQWVASADVSGTVRIWGSSGDHILRYEHRALSGRIHDLQWSQDGERIVVCGDGKGKSFVRAFLWDSGSSIGDFEGSSKRVLSCSFKPTRPFRIATGGEDFLVNFYEGPPFRFKASDREHTNYVNCVRFAPDGSKFITVGSDKKMVIYDSKSGDKISTVSDDNGHTGSIYAVCWSPKSDRVLTVSADKTAKIWKIAGDGSGSLEATYAFTDATGGAEDQQVGCLWVNDMIITFSLGGIINFLSLSDSGIRLEKSVSGHTKSVTAVCASDKYVHSSSYDGVIVKWRLGAGFVERLDGNGLSGVQGLTVCQDSLVAWDHNCKILQVKQGKQNLVDVGGACIGLSMACDLILACTEQEALVIRGDSVVSKIALPYTCTAVALSPDAKVAVVGDKDGKLHVYSVSMDACLSEDAPVERHRGAVTAIEFCPDGSLFASGDENREAFVWDSITREVKLKNMLYHTARIKCIAWASDSSKVATGSVDGCIFVYSIDKPPSSRISIKGAHPGGVGGIAFTGPNTFVSGGDDSCLRVWNC